MSQEIFDTFGSDPITLYRQWLEEAAEQEINDPDAACLATCSKDGRPSARMLLIKEIDETGVKFHTNAQSRKGEEMMDNPYAAICIYWKSSRKQIRIEGKIEVVDETESDAYFKTRPPARQIGAWASRQSKPFENRAELDDAIQKYTDKFKGNSDIPRPEYWKGFRLIPESFEFWIGNKDRVHTRFIYVRGDSGNWNASWLYP